MLNNANELNDFSKFNMATTKGLRYFTGEEEDIITWIDEIIFLTSATDLNEDETVKIILLQLRGVALNWASEVLGIRAKDLKLSELKNALINKFSSQQRTDI